MKKISIKAALEFGWGAVKKDFWYFIGLAFVFMLLTSIDYVPKENQVSLRLIGFLINTWLICGVLRIALHYYDKKKLPFVSLFTATKYFWRVLGASILLGLIVSLGFVLMIIPGIYLALRYQFVLNLIVDKDLGVFEAMKQSAILTNKIKLRLLVFNLASIGIILLGVLALGVGILVATPIVWLANIQIYRSLLHTN